MQLMQLMQVVPQGGGVAIPDLVFDVLFVEGTQPTGHINAIITVIEILPHLRLWINRLHRFAIFCWSSHTYFLLPFTLIVCTGQRKKLNCQ